MFFIPLGTVIFISAHNSALGIFRFLLESRDYRLLWLEKNFQPCGLLKPQHIWNQGIFSAREVINSSFMITFHCLVNKEKRAGFVSFKATFCYFVSVCAPLCGHDLSAQVFFSVIYNLTTFQPSETNPLSCLLWSWSGLSATPKLVGSS